MIADAWHPADERMAASAMAVFVEWLGASGRMTDAEPERVLAWARARGPGFDAAMTGFMGWDRGGPVLCPGRGTREAIIEKCGEARRVWTYDGLPECVSAVLAGADAVGLAAAHLLELGTRPDDLVAWSGVPADVAPLGALFIGATLVVTRQA